MPRRVIDPPPLDPAKTGSGAGERLPPILMSRDEVVSLKQAAFITGRSEETLRRWNQVHRIARQTAVGARLEFSRPALEMLMHGDMAALQALREGRRSDPQVKRYLDFLGLPI